MICYYPYIAKHKHFMIGHKYDNNGNLKYIVYALPGKNPNLSDIWSRTELLHGCQIRMIQKWDIG